MVISSSGKAAQHQGNAFGQFEYLEDKGYYLQTSTEQSNEKFLARYLYHDENDEWWVASTPGAKSGRWLRSRSSQIPPSSGWQYWDDGWQDDLTLTVTHGPLTLPRQFTVTLTGAAAEKWPSYKGVFDKTLRWWNGKPVYVNTEGRLLHHGYTDDGWAIASKLGYYALRGSQAHNSPAEEDSWVYWTGSERKPASVKVTGSD